MRRVLFEASRGKLIDELSTDATMFIYHFAKLKLVSSALQGKGKSKSIQVKLPRRDLKLDPRANYPHNWKFHCHYHHDGITVTLTRIDIQGHDAGDDDRDDDHGWAQSGKPLKMRLYDPNEETVPDFHLTTYIYLGVDGEYVPSDTIVAIIDSSVTTIKSYAFQQCKKMKTCILHDAVEIIEKYSFCDCISLHALFLPSSSLKTIEEGAFVNCENIRILPLPPNLDVSKVGEKIIYMCRTFFRITRIPHYEYDRIARGINDDQVHQAIMDFYRDLPPLHKTCLDVNVSLKTIHDCILAHGTAAASIRDHDGMTPLHILAMNPHATPGSIISCLNANMSAAFQMDSRGNSPLDYLKEYNQLECLTLVVAALCMHRNV